MLLGLEGVSADDGGAGGSRPCDGRTGAADGSSGTSLSVPGLVLEHSPRLRGMLMGTFLGSSSPCSLHQVLTLPRPSDRLSFSTLHTSLQKIPMMNQHGVKRLCMHNCIFGSVRSSRSHNVHLFICSLGPILCLELSISIFPA